MPQKIAVIGAGAWGTSLAIHLARLGHQVRLWVREPDLVRIIRETRENRYFLPGCPIPESVAPDNGASGVFSGAEWIVAVVPSHFMRATFDAFAPLIQPGTPILSATKGIENETCMLMSTVLEDVLGGACRGKIAAISGPTFAEEVVRGDPTAAVISAADESLARDFQALFAGGNLRLYTNNDIVGTQIGGAVKNVIAIAAGIIAGLGLGYNSTAGLITRGLAELKRFCRAAGGKPETLSGLAGLGDLVLTCTGALSRNRSLGIELGEGRKLDEVLAETKHIAEGVKTTLSTHTWARRLGVEMPITEQMHAVLYQGKKPREAIRELMERGLRSEFGG